MELDELWRIIVSASVMGFIGYLFGIAKDIKDKNEKEAKDRADTIKNILESLDSLQKILDDVSSDAAFLISEVKALKESRDDILETIKFILNDKIIQGCRHFVMLGSVPVSSRVALSQMYAKYKQIEKNDGACDWHYQMMLSLPVDPEGHPESNPAADGININCSAELSAQDAAEINDSKDNYEEKENIRAPDGDPSEADNNENANIAIDEREEWQHDEDHCRIVLYRHGEETGCFQDEF